MDTELENYQKTGLKPHPDSARTGCKYSPEVQPFYFCLTIIFRLQKGEEGEAQRRELILTQTSLIIALIFLISHSFRIIPLVWQIVNEVSSVREGLKK